MFGFTEQFNAFTENERGAGWAVIGLHNRKIGINLSNLKKKKKTK